MTKHKWLGVSQFVSGLAISKRSCGKCGITEQEVIDLYHKNWIASPKEIAKRIVKICKRCK